MFVITQGDTNALTGQLNELLGAGWFVKSVHPGNPSASGTYTYWLVVAEKRPG